MKTRAKWLIKSIAICNDTCCQSLINDSVCQRQNDLVRPGPTGPWRFGQRQSKIILSHCYTLPPFADDLVRTGPTRLKSCSDVQAGRGPHCCPLSIQLSTTFLSVSRRPFHAARFLSLPPTPTLFSLPSIHLIVITTLPFTQIN